MPPISEETGRRILAVVEELLATQLEWNAALRQQVALRRELPELPQPAFAVHWRNTAMTAFLAVGAFGTLVQLANFFGWPTADQVLAFPRTARDALGAVVSSVGGACAAFGRWCQTFKPARQPDVEEGGGGGDDGDGGGSGGSSGGEGVRARKVSGKARAV
ncbi:MAG: hypothetical protein JWP44_4835 [Mucilaginibacter sp.]|nr:hypothetical protein [Mucilaginibacter sp.]